jgi:hypothetical protein
MNVIFEICDWKDYNPLDGEYNPKGYTQEPVYIENFKCFMILHGCKNKIFYGLQYNLSRQKLLIIVSFGTYISKEPFLF